MLAGLLQAIKRSLADGSLWRKFQEDGFCSGVAGIGQGIIALYRANSDAVRVLRVSLPAPPAHLT